METLTSTQTTSRIHTIGIRLILREEKPIGMLPRATPRWYRIR